MVYTEKVSSVIRVKKTTIDSEVYRRDIKNIQRKSETF